jgi:hypothetical protein
MSTRPVLSWLSTKSCRIRSALPRTAKVTQQQLAEDPRVLCADASGAAPVQQRDAVARVVVEARCEPRQCPRMVGHASRPAEVL